MNINFGIRMFSEIGDDSRVFYNDEKYFDETFPYYAKSTRMIRTNSCFNISDWGESRWNPGRQILNRTNKSYIFHFIYEGAATFNGIPARKGDVIVTCPDAVHSVCGDRENPVKFYWIILKGHGVKDFIYAADNLSQQDPAIAKTVFPLETVLPLLREGVYTVGEISRGTQKIFSLFFRILSLLPRSSPDLDRPRVCQIVRDAILYVEGHYRESLSVAEIAEQVHVSRNHLYRLFMRDLQQSPNDYITSYRLKIATMLLETEKDTPISEIAAAAGYSNYSSFIKAFREVMQKTPTEYREWVQGKYAAL